MPIMCCRVHLCIMHTTLQVSNTFSLLKQGSAVRVRLSRGRDVGERCGSIPPVTSHAHVLTQRTCSTLPMWLHHDTHSLSRASHPPIDFHTNPCWQRRSHRSGWSVEVTAEGKAWATQHLISEMPLLSAHSTRQGHWCLFILIYYSYSYLFKLIYMFLLLLAYDCINHIIH